MNKLHKKDFTIAFKTGSNVNKSKFKKEAVQGEMYFATDSKQLYVAETTAGAIDATLAQFNLGVFESDFNISTRDIEANISASTPTNPSGEVTIAYGTDTEDFYIWDGSSWYVYKNI